MRTTLLSSILLLFASAVTAGEVVDPATYVGNVYGTIIDRTSGAPVANAVVGLFVSDTAPDVLRCRQVSSAVACVRAITASSAARSGTTNDDGVFLVNSVPAPGDGSDYTIAIAADDREITILERVHVLPGAVMALQIDAGLVPAGMHERANESSVATWRYRHETALTAPAAHTQAAGQVDTYASRVFATREGLVGGTTANGHVITTNDHFVALPTRRALSTNFGHEREVRLTYGTLTVTAPVWDVGPWNTHDDYWNAPEIRETFKDLPRGKPEAEAAYLSGYNGGLDERGRRVLNPAGIDLADGTFWLDLGLKDNAYVDVEYLWVDTTGPLTSALSATPVAGGINVDAIADDVSNGNSAIAAAEVFVDVPGADGSGFPATATDGAFDSPLEPIHAVISTAGWTARSTHTLFVHSRDMWANWGPMAGISVTTPALSGPARRRAANH